MIILKRSYCDRPVPCWLSLLSHSHLNVSVCLRQPILVLTTLGNSSVFGQPPPQILFSLRCMLACNVWTYPQSLALMACLDMFCLFFFSKRCHLVLFPSQFIMFVNLGKLLQHELVPRVTWCFRLQMLMGVSVCLEAADVCVGVVWKSCMCVQCSSCRLRAKWNTYIHMFVFLQKVFIYVSPPLSALDPGNRGWQG